MNIFDVFKDIRLNLEGTPSIWDNAKTQVRLFVMVEGDSEGVFIDSDKKFISFPVSVRDQPASATFIFTKEAFKMAFEGVMLSSLYEKDFLQASGDPKNIFSASLFLDLLLREFSENNSFANVDVDYSRLH